MRLGRWLGRFAFDVLRVRRDVVLANLRVVFGRERDEEEILSLARRSYGELGVTGILLVESRFSWAGSEMLSLLKALSMPIGNTCSYYEIPVIFYPDAIAPEARNLLTELPWQGFIINKPLEHGPLLK